MHELSLAQDLVRVVENALSDRPGLKATLLRVVAGRLSCVSEEALRAGLRVLSRGTRAEGAELSLSVPALAAECRSCGGAFEVSSLEMACPSCGSAEIFFRGGREIYLESIECEEEEDPEGTRQ